MLYTNSRCSHVMFAKKKTRKYVYHLINRLSREKNTHHSNRHFFLMTKRDRVKKKKKHAMWFHPPKVSYLCKCLFVTPFLLSYYLHCNVDISFLWMRQPLNLIKHRTCILCASARASPLFFSRVLHFPKKEQLA